MHAAWIRLRSHIVTGFIFIMPVLITLAVLMKFWNHLLKVGSRLAKLLHMNTVFGPPGDAVVYGGSQRPILLGVSLITVARPAHGPAQV